MIAELFWIEGNSPGRLAIMPRPHAGDWLADEAASWRRAGLDLVVSLLEADEIAELGLHDEADVCRNSGLQFIAFPIPDRDVPASHERFAELLSECEAALTRGQGVGIHCRMGVGRSALVAACLLVLRGTAPNRAFLAVSRGRGVTVPDTAEQVAWVKDWANRR